MGCDQKAKSSVKGWSTWVWPSLSPASTFHAPPSQCSCICIHLVDWTSYNSCCCCCSTTTITITIISVRPILISDIGSNLRHGHEGATHYRYLIWLNRGRWFPTCLWAADRHRGGRRCEAHRPMIRTVTWWGRAWHLPASRFTAPAVCCLTRRPRQRHYDTLLYLLIPCTPVNFVPFHPSFTYSWRQTRTSV